MAKILFIAGVVVPAGSGLMVLFVAVTMWLWNALMPAIFKLPEIGFWQAAGLLVLSRIFFKGGHASRSGRSQWRKKKMRDHMHGGETQPLSD
jgi:hypothetical protein